MTLRSGMFVFKFFVLVEVWLVLGRSCMLWLKIKIKIKKSSFVWRAGRKNNFCVYFIKKSGFKTQIDFKKKKII